MICCPLHCRGRAGEYRFSALSGPKCSKTSTPPRPRPSTPHNPAHCFSEEVTKVGFLRTIQRQHMLCIPLHCRGARGSTGFQHFQVPNVPKPVLPRVRGPAPVTNVGFLPTIQRQHMLCIPLHCHGRAGEYRFSALSGPKCSKTCAPPRPRASMNRGTGRNREPKRTGTEPLRTAIRFIPVQANPTEPNRTGTLL